MLPLHSNRFGAALELASVRFSLPNTISFVSSPLIVRRAVSTLESRHTQESSMLEAEDPRA